MRVLYKAIASVSMIALSAAATFGLRRLLRHRKNRATTPDMTNDANKMDETVDVVEQNDSDHADESDASQEPADVVENEAEAASSDGTADAARDDAQPGDVVEAETDVRDDRQEE